jgi:hypothetical protein
VRKCLGFFNAHKGNGLSSGGDAEAGVLGAVPIGPARFKISNPVIVPRQSDVRICAKASTFAGR